MIISRINGGLGNQMFQYAAGRALALRHGVDLVLDTRLFDGTTQFDLGLDVFNVMHVPASKTRLPPDRRASRLGYLLWRGLKLKPVLFRENGLGFNPGFERLGRDVYLSGYWQSERYFRDYEDRIREDFRIVRPPDAANRRMLEEIARVSAVSVHIRRGDYVSNARTNATHGTCSLDYFRKGLSLIAEQKGIDPVVFAFSDDPQWVRENLNVPFELRLADHNDAAHGYEDLRLMSACRHHVIANSSFSWWGAWLNPSPDKLVVAPKRWFADPSMSNPDICPDGWVRLGS